MQRIFLWTRKMSPTKTWAKNWAISGLLGHIHFSPLPVPPENFHRQLEKLSMFEGTGIWWGCRFLGKVKLGNVWCVNSLRYFSRDITLLKPSTCNALVSICLLDHHVFFPTRHRLQQPTLTATHTTFMACSSVAPPAECSARTFRVTSSELGMSHAETHR